jgi:hypothetical protein
MMNEFIWYCHESGYQIGPHLVPQWLLHGARAVHVYSAEENRAMKAHVDESGRSDTAWIRPVDPSTRADKVKRRYAPLRDTALFRKFADVECTSESTLNFANQFGLLTDAEKGESLATWTAAIADMRFAVDCWEQTQKAIPNPSSPGNLAPCNAGQPYLRNGCADGCRIVPESYRQ